METVTWSVRFGAISSTRTLATNLLPLGHGLQIRDVSIGPDRIVATLEATAPQGTCPGCGTWSEAVHSHYQRTIADLPWGGHTVRLHLRVRKFFCRQPTCARRIFTERLPQIVAPYARRTARLESILSLLAFALGGEAAGKRTTCDAFAKCTRLFCAGMPSFDWNADLGVDYSPTNRAGA